LNRSRFGAWESHNKKRGLAVLAVPSVGMNSTTENYLDKLAKDSTVSQRRGGHGAVCFIDGVFEALLAIEAISISEAREWNVRLLSAARGHSSEFTSSSGASSEVTYGGSVTEVAGENNVTQDAPQFLELIPVEGATSIVPGVCSIQILGIERYDSKVAISWRVAPLSAPAAAESLSHFAQVTPTPTPRTMKLTDDVGTRYTVMGGHSGGQTERVGRLEFRPAPPDSATRLFVNWEDAAFDIALPKTGRSDPRV